jgi:hypothetical protein
MDYLFELSQITGKSVLLIVGMPASWGNYFDAEGDGHYEYSWKPCDCSDEDECFIGSYDDPECWDCNLHFMRCYECLRVRVQYHTRYEPCEYCLKKTDKESPCHQAHPSLEYAVKAARSYRFDKRGREQWLTATASTVNGK